MPLVGEKVVEISYSSADGCLHVSAEFLFFSFLSRKTAPAIKEGPHIGKRIAEDEVEEEEEKKIYG